MCCTSAAEDDGRYSVLPLYVATMLWSPPLKPVGSASAACPDAPTAAVPNVVEPSVKVTLPTGAGAPEGAATVAVSVMAYPSGAGLRLEVRVTVADPRIVRPSAPDVDVPLVASPL